MAKNYLNSSVRGELPSSSFGHLKEKNDRKSEPAEVALPARCSIHKNAFLVLVQADGAQWRAVLGVSQPGSCNGLARQESHLQLLDAVTVDGPLVVAADYVGCPNCGDRDLFRCGCGTFSCGGATRSHGDHKDYLCGSCNRWACNRGKDGIRNFQAYANASLLPPRPEFVPEVAASEPAGRELQSPSERKLLPPASAIQRRR